MELRFECQDGCTNCCSRDGYVYLTEDDVSRAAAFLGVAQADFEKRYVYRTRHLLRFRQPRHSPCFFLREKGCSIHPAKPTQCRAFPFWPEVIETEEAWREAASFCPGIGMGQLVQIGTAAEISDQMRAAYPGIYGKK